MKIQTHHHVEAGEPDAHGSCDHFYEYDLIVFSDGEQSLVVRSYAETPHEAHFLGAELKAARRPLAVADLKSRLFSEAVAHLRHIGKTQIHWLGGRGNGYEPVPD